MTHFLPNLKHLLQNTNMNTHIEHCHVLMFLISKTVFKSV